MTDGAPGTTRGRVTLRDVAHEAGVSIKTVSRVVNGEREVNPATAVRVGEVLERLGYQPNELARSLRGQRSRTIGLIIADISNPFYSGCAKAVEEVVRDRGYTVILCASSEDAEVERAYVEMLTRRRVDGLLLVPAADGHEYLAAPQVAGLPVVALDRPVEEPATDAVVVQNRLGTREATEHLIGHGHRRIAFVCDDERLYTARKRLQGYGEALQAAGIEDPHRARASDAASAEEATRRLLGLPEPPTAFLAGNNLISVGVLRALDKAGLEVPRDAAFVGFDDFDLAAVLRPRLTVVRQPAYELGRRAAELLFERLEGRQPSAERERLVLPTELVVRESCGCHR
jgi:LacI family transcriptional regulator